MLTSLVSTGQDRSPEEWHEWRRGGVGASDAGAICGLSPWRSALATWLEKTGRTQPKRGGSERGPDWLYWGKRLEGVMAEEFADLYGLHVSQAGSWHERPSLDWQRATLDGLVFEGSHQVETPLALLELKTSSWRSPLSWEQGVPKLYQAQVQHQLMVTGLDLGYVAVLHDGSRFVVHQVERDEEAITALEEVEGQFWTCVVCDQPPPADGSRATEVAVRSAFASPAQGTSVVLDEDVRTRVRAYALLQEQRQALDEQLTQLRLQIMVALGDAEEGTDEQGKPFVSWKGYETQHVDLDGLRQRHPEIVQEFTRRSPARRFQIRATADATEEMP